MMDIQLFASVLMERCRKGIVHDGHSALRKCTYGRSNREKYRRYRCIIGNEILWEYLETAENGYFGVFLDPCDLKKTKYLTLVIYYRTQMVLYVGYDIS